jgi:AbrB family looped-hinge helix DNA binding protein
MNSIPVIFGKKGRTTIPRPLRRKLGWQAGDTLRFRLEGDNVVITREHAIAPADGPPARCPGDHEVRGAPACVRA